MSFSRLISPFQRLAFSLLAASLFGGGCVYEASDRCGPDQKLSATGLCVCIDGLVLKGTSCEPCAQNEQELDGVCACDVGYERLADGQACEAVVSAGIGASCNSAEPCSDAVFNVCRAGGVGGESCTRDGCATADDCGSDFVCNDKEAVAFCERPPVGQGSSCATSDDCAGTDAPFCESFISKLCLVPDCSLNDQDCFAGWECCDISGVGIPGLPKTICVPTGQCTL